ncbi:MAG TPA: DUF3667 domain-containing protein [Chthoniobacterales bacterium]|nr:DUF3667 domain-containing protein [Chthoniobacterales bacterium]
MADEPTKLILGDTAISAIEQPATKRFIGRRKNRQRLQLTHCENCGAQLSGKYCAQCGQPAIDYRRSFRHVIVDVLDSFLNWDSKFFATIALLIVKPWQLTNDFLAGKRVRYVHPLRLYLLASILFFFAANYSAKSIHLQTGNLSPKDRAQLEAELKNENIRPDARIKIERALNLSPSPSPAAQADDNASPKPEEPGASDQGDFGPILQMGPKNRADKPAFFQSGNPSTPFEKWIETRAKEKIGEHGSKAQLFVSTVINNLPYMMLCCIPLFAFVLKILYIRRRVFYVDHLVYALHIHTFAYVAIMLIVLLTIGMKRLAPSTTGWIAILWFAFAVQILLSIRRVYRQGWLFTIFKFFAGGFVYLLVLSVALAATFFVTLVMP